MQVFRLTKSTYANDLSGVGAAIAGGRWNKKGRAVVYTSENTALALLEIVVHLPPMFQPDLRLLTVEIPEEKIQILNQEQLPDNWYQYPSPRSLKALAESYYQNLDILGIKVPSSIVHEKYNLILNPQSVYFKEVKITDQSPFIFDPRLYRSI
ncbi:MAG: RES family NAD+ phosphorylase [Cecembia sp.]